MDDSFSFGMQAGSVDCSDFWDTLTSRSYLQPEKMLMLAILEDAWCSFEKHLPLRDKRFREEVEWFLEDGTGRFFSFPNICDVLRLDAGYIRQQLLRRVVKGNVMSDDFLIPSRADFDDLIDCSSWETRRLKKSGKVTRKRETSRPKNAIT